MKIKSVTATWLHVPIEAARQHTSDFGRVAAFDSTLVRIECESGLVGHGESKSQVGSASTNHALCAMIEQELGPLIVGEDARDISRLWDLMYNGVRAHYAIARGHVFPVLGRSGLTVSGISGIDMALWDILGKSLGAPVWQLLGGRRQRRMPAYASGGWAPAETIAEELQRFIDRGDFKAVKMRVGAADGTVRNSIRRVHAARDGLGPDIDLMCDAHGTFGVAEAKRFCRQVADCDIGWLEEPVSADDKPGMAEVRAATDIPIATGESEFTRFDFRDLALLRAADIFQPDLSIAGGITEAMRIEGLASAHQIRLAPHLWGGAFTFSAGLQVAAVASTGFILEYSLGANPMLHDLVEEDFTVIDGDLEIPDRPGLGLTVADDFVAKYRVD
ncbi:MAG: mandelate racemase/muconate lactonizing enzyme family protein [Alphaproteobacteria bacterium]|jgi:L-alanine-DL-glutamate epimerase-like enolase superfamily enzyme|nr:mandelate racemase/muconate lactonizing enzyme family protein [Alphaproteobacteria bacterium]MDP6515489.1 mandelate racemase/muconate lactonizing enzyme family protein [Alphaproteobacteria bacterium]